MKNELTTKHIIGMLIEKIAIGEASSGELIPPIDHNFATAILNKLLKLDSIESISSIIEWHPCNKRKSTRPNIEEDKYFLITVDRWSTIADGWVKDDIVISYYSKYEKTFQYEEGWGNDKHAPKIKAWAYLPEPYKKEEK